METALDQELDHVRELLLSALRPANMSILSCEVSNRWVDARIRFVDRINLANAMRNAKATVAKLFAAQHPGRGPVFAPGYMSRTLGSAIAPDAAVALILDGSAS